MNETIAQPKSIVHDCYDTVSCLKTLYTSQWQHEVMTQNHFAGFQIATNAIDEGIRASQMAAEAGADWLDLNCGCPIHGIFSLFFFLLLCNIVKLRILLTSQSLVLLLPPHCFLKLSHLWLNSYNMEKKLSQGSSGRFEDALLINSYGDLIFRKVQSLTSTARNLNACMIITHIVYNLFLFVSSIGSVERGTSYVMLLSRSVNSCMPK